ncbi:MAG TPA: hypothetical protein VEA80_14645 [Vitreimonas sp.]|uniref:hypothetical protein n=1 Tax=Vitreimonas sp. TaxID=3069702 RepID=UPI002D2203B3|nr:hypothetical protein [Vitreimonas sp.]HYD88710.1 hypothetical protein [Vitreimonas sp.]
MGTKGWHSRGYLPHYDGDGITQHIVLRLYDAVPPGQRNDDNTLDKGIGSALLRDPRCARIVAETITEGASDRYAYRLGA